MKAWRFFINMLPTKVFEERMEQCRKCSEWNGLFSVCLRGHRATSPTGCPMKKFPPIFSAAYDADAGRIIVLRDMPRCDGCGG